MKFGNRGGTMLVWLNIIIFTLSVTCITHAALLDEETIEVLYLFDEGEGEVAVDSSPNGRDGAII